jgi:3-dehydroquinate synthetase
MHSDKKARFGKLRFVLAPRIGKAESRDNVPLDVLERVLHFAPRFINKRSPRRG